MVSRGQSLKVLVSAVLKNLDFFFFFLIRTVGEAWEFLFFSLINLFNLYIFGCVGPLLLHMGFL